MWFDVILSHENALRNTFLGFLACIPRGKPHVTSSILLLRRSRHTPRTRGLYGSRWMSGCLEEISNVRDCQADDALFTYPVLDLLGRSSNRTNASQSSNQLPQTESTLFCFLSLNTSFLHREPKHVKIKLKIETENWTLERVCRTARGCRTSSAPPTHSSTTSY